MTLPESRHGMGTSPIIVGDLVILNCFGFENDPHLLALNKYNGKIVWKQSTSGNEEGATLMGVTIPPDSYSTPVIHQDQIIIYRSKDLILQARLLISRAKTATERRQIQTRWREIMERAAKLNPRDPYVIQSRPALQNR